MRGSAFERLPVCPRGRRRRAEAERCTADPFGPPRLTRDPPSFGRSTTSEGDDDASGRSDRRSGTPARIQRLVVVRDGCERHNDPAVGYEVDREDE